MWFQAIEILRSIPRGPVQLQLCSMAASAAKEPSEVATDSNSKPVDQSTGSVGPLTNGLAPEETSVQHSKGGWSVCYIRQRSVSKKYQHRQLRGDHLRQWEASYIYCWQLYFAFLFEIFNITVAESDNWCLCCIKVLHKNWKFRLFLLGLLEVY